MTSSKRPVNWLSEVGFTEGRCLRYPVFDMSHNTSRESCVPAFVGTEVRGKSQINPSGFICPSMFCTMIDGVVLSLSHPTHMTSHESTEPVPSKDSLLRTFFSPPIMFSCKVRLRNLFSRA